MEDRYLNYDQCINRLVREYKQHGRIILAIDFDNTLYDYHAVEDTYTKVEEVIKRAEKYTNVMVFTCRPKKQHKDIKEYLDGRGIKFDTINEPIIRLNMDDDTSKPFYSLLLDDRAGLFSACVILGRFVAKLEMETEDDEQNI